MSRFLNILVVDDDPLVLMNYVDILEDAGFNVFSANSLNQGLREISRHSFDLIICDNDLGDGKGTTLVTRLTGDGKDIPVIYLSAALPSLLCAIEKMKPVKKVLTKPVIPEHLLECVNEIVVDVDTDEDDDRFPELIGGDERDIILNIFNTQDEK